jgi:hypothetical protein
MISEHMVRLAQTMLLFCIDTITVPKRTKTRFHMTQVTKELHRVHPKHFLASGTFGAKHAPILHQD